MQKIILLTTVLVSVISFTSCNNESATAARPADSAARYKFEFTAEAAPDWSSLFYRNHGWFGGDGIFAVTRSGSEKPGSAGKEEALIWFSDTMFGDILNDSLKPGFGMINNSMAVLRGGQPDSTSIHFYWDSASGKPKSLYVPATPATGKSDYYWLGDGFVNQEKNNDLYIFGYRIRNLPDVKKFGFHEEGNTLVVVPANATAPFAAKKQLDIPFLQGRSIDTVGSFGAGLLVNTSAAGAPSPDGYLYVYGVRGKTKEVMVARVKPAQVEEFSEWRFWDGSGWSADVDKVKTIADRASNEMSVTALPDGRYLMVFQKDGIGNMVGLRVGTTPYGPFGDIQDVYDVSADLKESKNLFPYNAKAHPVLSAPGELLVSYNINSFDYDNDIRRFPHLYRPRFIRLKYSL
ncbi:MAG: DUF4185 domain-containing protein [Chitinophagaceae bacterium]|nr:MAG: DUF4185 domain-containing protein [Chitinophagaceae bacterium]